MASRAIARLRALGQASLCAFRPRYRTRPENPLKILVLHELLLGDTIMLAALFSRLRERHPYAKIYTTAPIALLPLFSNRPYDIEVLPFSERSPDALRGLTQAKYCDLAIIPGENRYSLIARAIGARWIVALAGAKPRWKNWLADQLIEFPKQPADLAEIFALLAGPTTARRFKPGDWPAPDYAAFSKPDPPYAVLHIGASTPLKHWPASRWRDLAKELSFRGYQVVWSAGREEESIVLDVDPQGFFPSYAGKLDLAQLWQLVAGARLLVTLDTGISHLAKLTGTRTICLYGPGSAQLVGRGSFWRDAPFLDVTVPDFSCRDQHLLFKREIPWVLRCGRNLNECSHPRCMDAIGLRSVLDKLPSAQPGT